jgi:glutathione S-transferase
MSAPRLVLHQHPFAAFCWKALIAVYELELPFETYLVDDAAGRELALQARLWDRVADGYVALPMQAIVGDSLRAEDQRDGVGVEQARESLDRACDVMHRPAIERVIDEARPYRHLFPLPWPSDVDAHQRAH